MRSLLIHLRLNFQMLLAPIFLWGMLLGGGYVTWRTLVAFLAFHIFLYGGGTAFNSYYDRDEGPIGGLEVPPPVIPALLPFSLGMLSIGLVLSVLVNPPFVVLYAVLYVMMVGYSQPLTRWKARPWPALITVVTGQGFGGFLGGWFGVNATTARLGTWEGVAGLASAAIMTLGFYPLTQLYQIDEDRRRGDMTPAVVWGAERCFWIAVACFFCGAVVMGTLLATRFTLLEGIVAALVLVALSAATLAWRKRFSTNSVRQNFHWLMRVNAGGAGAFGAYLLVRLALS